MTQIVVIDDERTFTAQGLCEVVGHNSDEIIHIIHLRNSQDAMAFLAQHCVSYLLHYGPEIYLFLDHDLGGDDTIGPVVDFLSLGEPGHPLVPGVSAIYIHSQNPVSSRMLGVLAQKHKTTKIPLPEMETP